MPLLALILLIGAIIILIAGIAKKNSALIITGTIFTIVFAAFLWLMIEGLKGLGV